MKNGSGFAGRLTKLRIKQQFSKSALARAVGVSTTAVINWEAGNTHPRPDTLTAIATTLGTTGEYLLGSPVPTAAKRAAGAVTAVTPPPSRADHAGLAKAVHEARTTIAKVAGVKPDNVKILLEY